MAEGGNVVQGSRGEQPRNVSSVDDAGTERLAVEAKVTGVAAADLDLADDEVLVGITTDGGATRKLAKGDTDGRFQVDVERMGNTDVSMDGGRQNTNANVQVGDADATAANPVPAQLSDGTDTASITAAGELNVLSTAQPGTDIGDVTVNNASGAAAVNVQDGGNSLTVDQATAANLKSEVSQPTASNLNAQIVGNVDHDAADSGNPVKVGMKAIAHGSAPSAVAVDDRTDWYANRHGVPFVVGGHPNVIRREYRFDTAQTNDDVLEAIGAGEKVVVTSYHLTFDEAGSTGVKVRVGFGAATVPSEPADGSSVAGMLLSHSGTIPGGGLQEGSGSGILSVGADGEELRITCEVPTGGSGRLVVTYYKVPS